MKVRFDDALPKLLAWVKNDGKIYAKNTRAVIVRDLRGQLRIICEKKPKRGKPTTNLSPSLESSKKVSTEGEPIDILGAFKAPGPFAIFLENSDGFEALYDSPDAYFCDTKNPKLKVLDRLVSGREWLYPSLERKSSPKRFVFHGLKGGVGRSTALSMTAWYLANFGKRVLVIDLDLEAPGLGNMLLPIRNDLKEEGDTASPGWPDYGVVDWFVEDAVSQADELLIKSMIQPSPIKIGGKGEIFVVPALGGRYKQDYVSKLSRVYIDIQSATKDAEVFGDRLARMVEQIEAFTKPDVVLLDSRAGIHHISAAALTRLGAFSYLFASDSEQTWAGYNSLFSHWMLKPNTVRAIRQSLRLISALTPNHVDREKFRDTYGEHSYDTFCQLYDIENPNITNDELFNFGVYDVDALHRPTLIWRDEIYSNFNPISHEIQLDKDKALLVFEELFKQIDTDLAEGN